MGDRSEAQAALDSLQKLDPGLAAKLKERMVR
jgi:hypothetical protein